LRRAAPGFGDLPVGPRRVAVYLRRFTDDEHQPFSISAQETSLGSYVNSQPGCHSRPLAGGRFVSVR
jgi:site-specific DNA recombinase